MRYPRLDLHKLLVAGIIALAISLRILITYMGWPGVNSDEGTMGLMALHIAYHGEFPVFFYGQGYTGSLEAYLGAVFFHLLGASAFALRLGVILIFGLFLVSMYLLTSLLYTKNMALAVLLLLSLGSSQIMILELIAIGNYPETLLFGAILLLLASRIALTSRQSPSTSTMKGRNISYACFGCVIGLALWSDFLILPFILMASLLLVISCWQEIRQQGIFYLLAGLVITLIPVFVYNATVPLNQGTLSVFGTVFGFTNSGQLISQPSLAQKITGTVLISIPNMTGADPICSIPAANAWPLPAHPAPHILQCMVVRGCWGVGFLALLATAFFIEGRRYWKLLHMPQTLAEQKNRMQRQNAIRTFARLALLGSAGLTLAIFAVSLSAGQTPWPSARYLIGLLVTMPAVISPLWGIGKAIQSQSSKFATMTLTGLRYAVLLLIGTAFLLGTIDIFLMPGKQIETERQFALIHDLLHIGATHIYTDYWTCDRIAFQSQEQIVCSVVDEQLRPGINRYLRYDSIVRADPYSAYVFPDNSPQAAAIASQVMSTKSNYQHFTFDGYTVYRPVAT